MAAKFKGRAKKNTTVVKALMLILSYSLTKHICCRGKRRINSLIMKLNTTKQILTSVI